MNDIQFLDFLVLDEADRMIETGHFAELEHILRLTLRQYRLALGSVSELPLIEPV